MPWYDFLSNLFTKKPGKPSFRKPSSNAKTCYIERSFYQIKNEADLRKLSTKIPGSTLSGKSLDLRGAILDGKKLKGDGGQNENQDPLLRIELAGVTIKNGFCQNVKDGMRADAPDVSFIKLTFLDVGEDGVSCGKEGVGTKVIDCEFDNSKHSTADKSIQLNNGKNALVDGCTIYGGITAIRMGDTWNSNSDIGVIKNTKFVRVDTAINLAKIKVKLSNNTFSGVKTQVKHSHGSSVIG